MEIQNEASNFNDKFIGRNGIIKYKIIDYLTILFKSKKYEID